jgi:hypothetical protein
MEAFALLIIPVLFTIIAALLHGKLPSWAKGVMWTLVAVLNLSIIGMFGYSCFALWVLSGGNL